MGGDGGVGEGGLCLEENHSASLAAFLAAADGEDAEAEADRERMRRLV